MPISDKKWREYHVRLAGLARNKLGGTPRALKDEDDIAASALKSFFGGVEEGRFQIPEEEEFSLWPLLAVIAARKCAKLIEYLRAGKRDPGRLDDAELDQLVDSISSPASVAEHEEGKQQLLAALDNDRQRQIAIWKMEGYSHKEIAEKLGCVERTLERQVELIKKIWAQAAEKAWGKPIDLN